MTKKETKDKRIKDILDAAIHEFVEKGYEATSMESIAVRAGLTKGGLYYHFESKDDILIKANELFMEPVLAFMAEAMGRAKTADGLAVIYHPIPHLLDTTSPGIILYISHHDKNHIQPEPLAPL